MATDSEMLSKFLDEYNFLKKEHLNLNDKLNQIMQREQGIINSAEQARMQILSLQNENQIAIKEINRLKRENQKTIEQKNFLNDQLNQMKELYQDTRLELQESFQFIQSIKKRPKDEIHQVSKNCKTGTFSEDIEDTHVMKDTLKPQVYEDSYYKQCVEHLFEVFSVNNLEQLISTADKIRTVMSGVQQIEHFCRQLCEIVLDEGEFQSFDQILPVVQQWRQDSKYVECFVHFKQQLENVLQIRNSTDQTILETIRNLQYNNSNQAHSNENQQNRSKAQLRRVRNETN